MSEHGKYWNPKRYEDDTIKKTPLNMDEEKSIDSSRPTMVAPETHKAAEKNVKNIQDHWRRTRLFPVAWISTIIGIGGGSYYMYKAEQESVAPKDTVVETAATALTKEESREETPWEIKTEEDLKEAFKKYKIPNATAQDFNFETKKQEYQAKTLMYKQTIVGNKTLNVKDQYAWVGVNDKILKTEDPAILIAVHLMSDYAKKNAATVVNSGPGAHPYRTKMVDEKDPSIIYFYFDKCRNTINEHAFARIRIQSPTNPKKHLWYQAFNMPTCQNEINGVESDGSIQK